MKAIEVVNEIYNIFLINVTDFYHYFMAFIKKFYDFLMFKKVIKMFKNYEEILKHNLVTAGLEPVTIRSQA